MTARSDTNSPPPTPTTTDEARRFKDINSPCEWVERYRPGGYHPVHLGDSLNNGQYKVLRKLGEGSFSTVWLARDLKENRYVALKINISTESTNELNMLKYINKAAPTNAPLFITQLLNDFTHRGPNGIHKCLIFEPMGPSVNVMVEELPQFKPRKRWMKIRYPIEMAKSILKQSLTAISFLYENGISQGDFQPGNMLFTLENIDSKPEHELRQVEDVEGQSTSPPVERLDGKEDKWAPRYLCIAQPLAPYTHHGKGFKIKLSDMGGAYFFNDPPKEPIIPRGLRSPELILTGSFDKTIDIWTFGCLMFELITAQPLFCIPYAEDEEEADDEHLLTLTDRIGALPDHLYRNWKRSSLYFTPERKLCNCELGGVPEGGEPYMQEQISMEDQFDQAKPDLGEDEARQVKRLIRWILNYDPKERPSPAEILRDPWFCEID